MCYILQNCFNHQTPFCVFVPANNMKEYTHKHTCTNFKINMQTNDSLLLKNNYKESIAPVLFPSVSYIVIST